MDPLHSPQWPRAIIHVDLDAFYASAEQRDNPELRGLPIAVGGGADEQGHAAIRRGVVSAASYEARKYGVHSAMPLAQALRLCPQLIVIPVNFPKYRAASKVIFQLLHEVTPLVEPLSLDEAFLDVTASQRRFGSPPQIAAELQRQIKDHTALDASFGVSTCRTVAKIASDFRKPRGFVVVPPGEERKFLAPLPLRTLPGLGPATERALSGLGISTLGQLASLPLETLCQRVGDKHGVSLRRRARGLDDQPVVPPGPPKSISREETFAVDVDDAATCEARLRELASDVGGRLRAQSLVACTVTLKLRYSDFSTKLRQQTLPVASAADMTIARCAIDLFHAVWSGAPVRLLGVGSGNLASATQGDIFGTGEQLDAVLDGLRAKFGGRAIHRGAAVTLADMDVRGDDLRRLKDG